MKVDDKLFANLLQTDNSSLKLSIYQPTQPASTGDTVQEDSIRFKNALQAIRADDSYDDRSLAETMKTLDQLVNDADFWKHQARGLALFADRDGYQVVQLNYDVTEAYFVGQQYVVSPLVLVQSLGADYYILDVSLNSPRLLEATSAGCRELAVDSMPESFAAMTENIEYKRELQHHSGGVGAFHGHDDQAAVQDDTMKFYRKVAEAVDGHMQGKSESLVILGVKNHIGPMRQLLSYGNLIDDYAEGSGEAMNEQALHQKTRSIAENYIAAKRNDLISNFNETPPDRKAVGYAEIMSAAKDQRVETMILPSFRYTADTVHDGTDEAIVLQLPTEHDDMESAVRLVLAQGGQVVAVATDAFEDKRPRALCRY